MGSIEAVLLPVLRVLCGESFVIVFCIALAAGVIAGAMKRSEAAQLPGAKSVTATRLPQNPLITINSSSTLGDNVNGPAIIRVPSWIERPLGRYYMYFAHHMVKVTPVTMLPV